MRDARRTLAMWIFAAVTLFLPAALAAQSAFTYDHGGIVRGDRSRKQLALVFTGGDYGEGTAPVLDVLRDERVPASLFVTGGFLRQPEQAKLLRRAVREGHYVGPHSDQHLLYAPWEDRDKSSVSEQQFKQDLSKNLTDLRRLGALPAGQPVFFIPPYEWFNRDQVRWSRDLGVTLFNFSPGSGSNRDYLPESDKRFVSSREILRGILDYEKSSPDGLNGFILLLHLGADRRDKMYLLLPELIHELRARGHEIVRIDKLLGTQTGTSQSKP
jgi:peptidoglycan/xylan/chitin deacetylase (PgdA/CDA1 family)